MDKSARPQLVRGVVFNEGMKSLALITLLAFSGIATAQSNGAPPIVGQWDLTVSGPQRTTHAAWLEVRRMYEAQAAGFNAWEPVHVSGLDGRSTLVGRFVGRIGGARPVTKVDWSNGVARFSIPPEWEAGESDLRFEGRVEGDSLTGSIVMPDGKVRSFTGRRAPSLRREMPKEWSKPVPLFNGKDLTGWAPTPIGYGTNNWVVRAGVLVNTEKWGQNLMTVQRFQDFKLHAEFRFPKSATTGLQRACSGILPRGRYWILLKDYPDREWPSVNWTGTVYNFLIPSVNAGLGTEVWQSIDITLVGRRITIIVNGTTVITDQIIPGITGSAFDSDEAAPGPIILQGEETSVEFRNITIRVPRQPR